MRKHGRRGTLSSKLWTKLASAGGTVRKRVQLSFESGRQTCLWQTGSRTAVIKH